MAYEIVKYSSEFEEKWDNFVMKRSMNGTFLQTINFLNYHPENRFTDFSLIIKKGNEIIGVIPACDVNIDGSRVFFSHRGSTFGGIILSKNDIAITSDLLKIFFALLFLHIQYNLY